jgi:hypothetical protein
MIGGFDFIFAAPHDALSILRQEVLKIWPFCTERAENEQEVFFYKNEAIETLWETSGLCAETQDTMLYVIFADGEMTIVVDEDKGDSKTILDAIREKFGKFN